MEPENVSMHLITPENQRGLLEGTKELKKQMEAQGFFSLPEFFRWKADSARQQGGAEVEAAESVTPVTTEAAEAMTAVTTEVAEAAVAVTADWSTEVAEAVVVDLVATSAVVLVVEKAALVLALAEEEEEDEVEVVEANKMTASAHTSSAEGGTMLTHTPSTGDPGDFKEILKPCWGPSWTILYESKELSSSCCSDSDTLRNLEDLQGTQTRELDSLCHGNAPDNAATQQPMDSTLELL